MGNQLPNLSGSKTGLQPTQRIAYYGGVYRSVERGGKLPWRASAYRKAARSNIYGYYGDWRQSFSPFWGLAVTTELITTAPAFHYYGIGYGDPYGYEVPVWGDEVGY